MAAPQKKSRAIEEEKKAWDEKKVKQTSKLSYLVKGFIHESGQCIDNWTRAEIQECHLGHRNYGKGHQITSELGQAPKHSALVNCTIRIQWIRPNRSIIVKEPKKTKNGVKKKTQTILWEKEQKKAYLVNPPHQQ